MRTTSGPQVTVRGEPAINQARFDALGYLITLETFARFSGLPKWTIMGMRRSGAISAVTVRRGKGGGAIRHRYFKKDLAQLAGFDYGRR